MTYEPTLESVSQHPVPDWYNDAKLGIFIHWGLYSVPAWASTGMDLGEVIEGDDELSDEERWRTWFAHNAYAEWYMNTYRIDGSPGQVYHHETYGEDFDYSDFIPLFNEAIESWNPDEMAALFKEVNAEYVVLTTKHHDGFLMWPSQTPNPFHENYHASRDIVGELGQAVNSQGMRMAYYYSGGVDWTFNTQIVQTIPDLRDACPQQKAYVDYANAHWRELIDRYDTAILWNDIGYPQETNVHQLFADYYNKMPDGVVNNRFHQHFEADGNIKVPVHFDFETPEYASFDEIREKKWESCRGIGHSFGYNQIEGPEHHLTVEELVRSFVDIVSKNGNLLLNVGPKADGTIPEIQKERLTGLGRWLDRNGEAIFATRPWQRAEGTTNTDVDVRFTQKDGALYATLMGTPSSAQITLNDITPAEGATITLLGNDDALPWEQTSAGVAVTLPDELPDAPAHSLKIQQLA